MPDSLDAPRLLERLQETLDAEVSHQRDVLAPLGGQTDLMLDAVATLLRGGKRVRASFLYWGYRGCGARRPSPGARRACRVGCRSRP